MQLSDFQKMIDNFSQQVDKLVTEMNNLKQREIVIDLSKGENSKKVTETQEKLNALSKSVETRVGAMHNQCIGSLHEIYNQATSSLEPYKTIAEAILAISAPGANLGELATFASNILNVLTQVANHYTAQYTEPAQTITSITSVVSQLSSASSQLSSIQLPNVKVIQPNGQITTWTPTAPSISIISISDVISGTPKPEPTPLPFPTPLT